MRILEMHAQDEPSPGCRCLDSVRPMRHSVRMARRAGTVKKTYNLPPELVARAKRVLKVSTETEAIVRALEEVGHEDDIHRGVRRAGGRLPGFSPLR